MKFAAAILIALVFTACSKPILQEGKAYMILFTDSKTGKERMLVANTFAGSNFGYHLEFIGEPYVTKREDFTTIVDLKKSAPSFSIKTENVKEIGWKN